MTSPQERINEKIKDTENVIKRTNDIMTSLGLPDYLSNLQKRSLEMRLSKLSEEKKEIQRVANDEEVMVTMHPPELPSGQITIRTLSKVLGGLQDLSDSIANTIFNQPSEKGKIPQEILKRNEFILTETKAGSFKAILNLRHSDQLTLDDELPEQEQTVLELFKLFNSSNSQDDLADIISDLGPRTLRNYSEWTQNIKDLNTPIDIDWVSAHEGRNKISFSAQKVELVHSMLNSLSDSTSEEEISISGTLTGANVRKQTFEIIDESGNRITGRVVKDAIPSVATFGLNKKCIANILKVTVKGPVKERVSWTLKEITEDSNTDKLKI